MPRNQAKESWEAYYVEASGRSIEHADPEEEDAFMAGFSAGRDFQIHLHNDVYREYLRKNLAESPDATVKEKEQCVECGDELPPLNGVEENDFGTVCEGCSQDG